MGIKLHLGLTDSDIKEVNSQVPSNVYLINRYVVNGNSDTQVRGKWSSAANSLAKTLEIFSSTLEDGLTVGLEALGFSGGVAKKFAQGIAWALFSKRKNSSLRGVLRTKTKYQIFDTLSFFLGKIEKRS